MEIASIILAVAAVFLFWNIIRKSLKGAESALESLIETGGIHTDAMLADAMLTEAEKALTVVSQLGYNVKDTAVVPTYRMILAIRKAEPSQQKKLAEELRLYLLANQAPTPTAAPTPAPTAAPVI